MTNQTTFLRWLPLVAAICVLIVSAMLFMKSRGAASSDEIRALGSRMDAMDARIDGLGGNDPPQSRKFGERRTAEDSGRASRQVGLSSEDSPASSAEHAGRDQAKARQALEALFAAQRPAPRSDTVPQQAIATFQSDGVVSAVDIPKTQDIVCRADMCMIQAQFAAGADASDWATRVMLGLGGVLPSYRTVSIKQPDGSTIFRVYAARADGRPGG